tara:strand:+ start:5466 stop:8369 length:2904 start_codon:yes stop_codon:yes gene_type:complete
MMRDGGLTNLFEDVLDIIGIGGDDDNSSEYVAELTEPEEQDIDISESQDGTTQTVYAQVGTNIGLPIIYGTRRTGGILIYQEVSSATTMQLYKTFALAEGVQQQWTVYLDDVALPSSKYWRDSGSGAGASIFDRLVYVNGYGDSGSWAWGSGTGTDAGIPDPDYGGGDRWAGSNEGADHKCKGFAVEQLTFLWGMMEAGTLPAWGGVTNATLDPDVWKNGMPKIEFEMTGMALVDHNGVSKNSSDPAWVLYDYLTNTRYGCGLSSSVIDTASFTSASTICNVVNNSTKRHECNIILDPTETLLTNIERILATCNGRLDWINGLYTLQIDDEFSGTPAFAFEEKHIIGGINIVGNSKNERTNQVTAKFINPNQNWQGDEVSWPDKNSETTIYNNFLTADKNIPLVKTINLGGVTNYNQARYLAKQMCLRSRDAIKCSFRSTSEAMEITVGDIITVTHSTPGWSAKEFRVRTITLNTNGTNSISAVEHLDSIYAWDYVTEPSASADTNLPDVTSSSVPTNLSLSESVYSSITSGGKKIRATLTWTASTDFTVKEYDFEFKKTSDSDYTPVGTTASTTGIYNDFEIGNFDFRVRARNSAGGNSAWVVLANQEIAGVMPIPQDVENFEVNINSADANTVLATWDAPNDADLVAGGHLEIRNLMPGSTTWDEAEILATVSGSTTSVLLPLMEGNYVAKWIGSEGTEAVAFVESGLGTVFWTNTIQTINYHSDFEGTLTNLYVADNDGTKLLKFNSAGFFDNFPALDSITTKFDEYGGSLTSGEYVTNAYDLEQAFNMRLYTKKVFTSGVSDGSNYMDTWGKVDLRNSWDDAPRLAGVTSYLRTTLDDPTNVGASWTDYKKFQIADVRARGVQLKIKFNSDQGGAEQFRMSELSLLIDMKAKVVGENDKTSTSITYQENFHARPNLVVTPKNLVSGDYMTISSETKLGFNVNFYNSSGGSVTRNYNYLAKGVG